MKYLKLILLSLLIHPGFSYSFSDDGLEDILRDALAEISEVETPAPGTESLGAILDSAIEELNAAVPSTEEDLDAILDSAIEDLKAPAPSPETARQRALRFAGTSLPILMQTPGLSNFIGQTLSAAQANPRNPGAMLSGTFNAMGSFVQNLSPETICHFAEAFSKLAKRGPKPETLRNAFKNPEVRKKIKQAQRRAAATCFSLRNHLVQLFSSQFPQGNHAHASRALSAEERQELLSAPVPADKESHKNHNCTICQEGFEKGQSVQELNCNCAGRFYHSHCISQWFNRASTCPACRSNQRPEAP